MHEHVVHALDHAVPFDPKVLAIAVRPVAIHPNAVRTADDGLLNRDDTRRRRRHLARGDRLGLLHDDHGLAFDLLGSPLLDLDHDVARRLGRRLGLTAGGLATPRVTIV